jgi:3',5'-cyclic-AMP phosphodiesterase
MTAPVGIARTIVRRLPPELSPAERAGALAALPLRIAQISDIHCGHGTFDADWMQSLVERLNAMRPDVVLVVGDLTAKGYEWEYEEAARWLQGIEAPQVVIPGNHDYRNVGYIHYKHYFGEPFSRVRVAFEPVRAERLVATGVTVVGVDSAEPDINEGNVGMENYQWIREQFDEPDDVKVFAIHHHLVPIPGTGRERNIITDAGDLLAELTRQDLDVIVAGHKHVPFFWGLNGILLCNSGTATTKRIRGRTPPSWNEIVVDASTIKVYVHYADGRRQLAVIFNRKTRRLTREAFYLTEAFLETNQVLPP